MHSRYSRASAALIILVLAVVSSSGFGEAIDADHVMVEPLKCQLLIEVQNQEDRRDLVLRAYLFDDPSKTGHLLLFLEVTESPGAVSFSGVTVSIAKERKIRQKPFNMDVGGILGLTPIIISVPSDVLVFRQVLEFQAKAESGMGQEKAAVPALKITLRNAIIK